MAARTRKEKHDDFTRERIRTSQLVNRLECHVFGDVEMKPTQVTAALGLLRKTLPDLSQSDVTHTVKHGATDYSRDELIAILEQSRRGNGSSGTTEANGRGSGPDSVH